MKFATVILASAMTFIGSAAFAQSAATTNTKETQQMDTSTYNKGSVWIKDSGQGKEYLKSIGQEDRLKKPQATQPTIYQQNGSVWCKNGTVVDREKGVICQDEPKK